MTYDEALRFMLGLQDFERDLRGLFKGHQDLSHLQALLALLDNPQERMPAVHIAGSKGKGSIAAMIDSIIRHAGVRSGLYTSPHLQDFRERIQVHGRAIPREAVARLTPRVVAAWSSLPAEDRHKLTTFEAITGLAWLHFVDEQVEVAVMEVGLGGRLDATNLLRSRVCAFAPISYEHTEVLGTKLSQIAREKAGILKPGIPAVSAAQAREARAVLVGEARRVGAPLSFVGEDWRLETGGGGTFNVTGPSGARYQNLRVSLTGRHQVENGTVAVGAAHVLLRGWPHALRVEEAVRQGLAAVQWPGRFELLRRRPTVVVDGAHNRESARRLAETLRELDAGSRLVLVVGTSGDKDAAGIFAELAPLASSVLVTRSAHPRAADPAALAAVARRFTPEVAITLSVEEALRRALSEAGESDVVCLTGSLFVAGEARAALGYPSPADENPNQPPPG